MSGSGAGVDGPELESQPDSASAAITARTRRWRNILEKSDEVDGFPARYGRYRTSNCNNFPHGHAEAPLPKIGKVGLQFLEFRLCIHGLLTFTLDNFDGGFGCKGWISQLAPHALEKVLLLRYFLLETRSFDFKVNEPGKLYIYLYLLFNGLKTQRTIDLGVNLIVAKSHKRRSLGGACRRTGSTAFAKGRIHFSH